MATQFRIFRSSALLGHKLPVSETFDSVWNAYKVIDSRYEILDVEIEAGSAKGSWDRANEIDFMVFYGRLRGSQCDHEIYTVEAA